MKKVCARWVPRPLTGKRRQNCLDLCVMKLNQLYYVNWNGYYSLIPIVDQILLLATSTDSGFSQILSVAENLDVKVN